MQWAYELLVLVPAGIIGGLAGMVIGLAILVTALLLGGAAGTIAERLLIYRVSGYIAKPAIIIIGVGTMLYVGIVLWEARDIMIETLIRERQQADY